MKARANNLANIKTGKTRMGISIYFEGRWFLLAENGKPKFFRTATARDKYIEKLKQIQP
jgi:hypothetical protein